MKKYNFIISAYIEEGEKEDAVAEVFSFEWDEDDVSGAKEHAFDKARRKWNEDDGYYGHEVKTYKGE